MQRGANGHVVRLGEVAEIAIESADRRASFRGNGTPQIGLGVIRTSTANSLDVAHSVESEIAWIDQASPHGIEIGVSFGSTVFIDEAVARVYWTLLEATVLVASWSGCFLARCVPYWFRQSRSRFASFPRSLWGYGSSIDSLTLLALVLAIGSVVDDAIVMLENAQRCADLHEQAPITAWRGTRQVAFAVLATTVVLVAMFLPVAFIEGNKDRLFRELAGAMAAAVSISALIALSPTSTMCFEFWCVRIASGAV